MLNNRQLLYCEGILDGLSQVDAYGKAYNSNSRDAAKNGGSLLMKNPEVRQYLDRRRREIAERTDITIERTLKEIARVAYSDIREFVSWDKDGAVFVPSDKLTLDQAAAIMSIKTRTRSQTDKEGQVTTVTEMELKAHPKMDALEKLMKAQGAYQKDRENEADAQANLLATVLWRYVFALHADRGISVMEALALAERNPSEVEKWGREVMLIPAEVAPSD